MLATVLSPRGPFGAFADWLLANELPGLPADRRNDVVAFTCRRAAQTPTPLRLGVTALSAGVGALTRVAGAARTGRFVRGSRLPFLGELPRMVRSLAFAYIWETWPTTQPDGSPA